MTIDACLRAAVLMFAAVHFGIVAVYSVRWRRAAIFGTLAVLAFTLGVCTLLDFAGSFGEFLLLVLIAAVNIAVVRYKVMKRFGVRRFRLGRWWRLTPFVVEFAAVAALLALHIHSHFAAECFFDRMEKEIDTFNCSTDTAARLSVPAPKGSRLLLVFPYTPVKEPDLPASVIRRLNDIGSVRDGFGTFVLMDAAGRLSVRENRQIIHHSGDNPDLRWDEASGVIRIGIGKDVRGLYFGF